MGKTIGKLSYEDDYETLIEDYMLSSAHLINAAMRNDKVTVILINNANYAMTGGQNFHYTTRVNGGAWTDTTTQRAFMGILANAFDDAVGGGAANDVFGIIQ